MRHQKKNLHIGKRGKDHKESLLKNLAASIIIHEKIKTTRTKAKALAPFVERLINLAKNKDKMNAIREISKLLNHEDSSRKILDELTTRYSETTSGYTRIISIGARKGDNAPMVQIELT